LTSRLFAAKGVSLSELRREIEGRASFREKVSTSVEIPFSADTKRILQYGGEEADRLLHNYIGTEHLLLGILRAEGSGAATLLVERGLALAAVRDEIARLTDGSSGRDVSGPGFADLPAYLPSETVHISVTRRPPRDSAFAESAQHWVLTGADLRTIFARLYPEVAQVDLQGVGDDGARYDVALVLPQEESAEKISRLVRAAVEGQFGVMASRERGPEGERLIVRRHGVD
jgi:hypothetical protein